MFLYSTGLSLHHGMASSPLSYSVTDSYAEYKSFEESFPSPELFRKSDYLGEKVIPTLNCSTIEITPLSTNPPMNKRPFREGILLFLTNTSLP